MFVPPIGKLYLKMQLVLLGADPLEIPQKRTRKPRRKKAG
jgi:hypothetical protein